MLPVLHVSRFEGEVGAIMSIGGLAAWRHLEEEDPLREEKSACGLSE